MNDYMPEKGHWVRVVQTREGVVLDRSDVGGFTFRDTDGSQHYANINWPFATIERLPDPEPEWQPRDVVLDASGRCYERSESGFWFRAGSAIGEHIDLLRRPLIPLVRDGKPWGEQ